MKDKKSVKLLEDYYDELFDHLHNLEQEIEHLQTEQEYMSGFISYYGLEDQYVYFRNHAYHKSDPELPFPFLSL